jgi:hypothetical protein
MEHKLRSWLMVIFTACLLSGCGFPIELPRTVPEPGKLPVPSNAQGAQTKETSMGWLTTFQTANSPQLVKDFYKRELSNRGWVLTDEHPELRFKWLEGGPTGGVFFITVETTPTANGCDVALDVEYVNR